MHGPDAIRETYRDTGGIEPSAKQVDDFVDYLHRGGTVQGARMSIAQVDGGNTANRYANSILGHDLSAEQRAQYVDRLTHGATQAEVRHDIVYSAEATRAVGNVYNGALGRNPDPGGLQTQLEQLDAGRSLADVRHDIVYSAEATRAVGNIYNAALGRNPDPGGLQSQLQRLADNKSLSDLRREIAFSLEATSRLTQQTSDLIRKAGIEQGSAWSGVPEAISSLQGTIADGHATMGQVQTAIERGVYATSFPGSTVSTASLLKAFSLVAVRSVPAVEGLSAAAMAESAAVIVGEVAAGSVVIGAAAPIVATAAIGTAAITAAVMLWPTVSSWIHGGNDKPISADDWGKRDRFVANVKAAIAQSKNTDWADVMNGGDNQDPRDKLQIHHCVPLAQPGSEEARDILKAWKIDINSPANASIIPQRYHFSPAIHGGAGSQQTYGKLINTYMRNANDLAKEISLAAGGGDAGDKAGRNFVMNSLRTFCDNLTYDSGDTKAKLAQNIMRIAEKAFIGEDNQ